MILKYLNELLPMILKDQITNIFVKVDDFCKEFDQDIRKMKLVAIEDGKKRRNRKSLMSDSEIITIMIGFHLGGAQDLQALLRADRVRLLEGSFPHNALLQ